MLACWNLGQEEERVVCAAVGRGDDLSRNEESVDIEREVERRRLGVEIVLPDADGERVRTAFGNREVPGKRTRALGGVERSVLAGTPRAGRGHSRRSGRRGA